MVYRWTAVLWHPRPTRSPVMISTLQFDKFQGYGVQTSSVSTDRTFFTTFLEVEAEADIARMLLECWRLRLI